MLVGGEGVELVMLPQSEFCTEDSWLALGSFSGLPAWSSTKEDDFLKAIFTQATEVQTTKLNYIFVEGN